MVKSRGMASALVVVFVLMAAAACAADKEVKIGVVDTGKVNTEAPRMKQYMEELTSFGQLLKTKVDIRTQNIMLDETEVKDLIDLKTKTEPTEADKAKIADLETKDRDRDAELKSLQEGKELNDQQKARLKELQELQQKSKDAVNQIAKDYDESWQNRLRETDTKAQADLEEAIKKVAEAKALTIVVAKITVFYGGIDITDDVIGKLDRKSK